MKCPKCNKESGGDWAQCDKVCPIQKSPHYDEKEEIKYFNEKQSENKPVDFSDIMDMIWFID